jgi:hypothetical protein
MNKFELIQRESLTNEIHYVKGRKINFVYSFFVENLVDLNENYLKCYTFQQKNSYRELIVSS